MCLYNKVIKIIFCENYNNLIVDAGNQPKIKYN